MPRRDRTDSKQRRKSESITEACTNILKTDRSDELFLVPVFASSYVVIDILLVFQEKEL